MAGPREAFQSRGDKVCRGPAVSRILSGPLLSSQTQGHLLGPWTRWPARCSAPRPKASLGSLQPPAADLTGGQQGGDPAPGPMKRQAWRRRPCASPAPHQRIRRAVGSRGLQADRSVPADAHSFTHSIHGAQLRTSSTQVRGRHAQTTRGSFTPLGDELGHREILMATSTENTTSPYARINPAVLPCQSVLPPVCPEPTWK